MGSPRAFARSISLRIRLARTGFLKNRKLVAKFRGNFGPLRSACEGKSSHRTKSNSVRTARLRRKGSRKPFGTVHYGGPSVNKLRISGWTCCGTFGMWAGCSDDERMNKDEHRAMREQLGLSQTEVANRLGVTKRTIQRREGGGTISKEDWNFILGLICGVLLTVLLLNLPL
jgi:DNA-binding XRE family transcriptional regulator